MLKNKLLVSSASMLLVSTLLGQVSLADEEKDDGKIDKKIVTYGANVDQQQKENTGKLLDADDSYKEYMVNSQDVQKYTGKYYENIYSSASITPKKFGKGVDVKIVTPDDITDVTETQYENAAISAGIKDADIKVGAVVNTLGYGALSGIYKAYEEQGNQLNEEDVRNADQEMQDLSKISNEHKNDNDKKYSDDALNKTVADSKKDVADAKKDNQSLNEDDVNKIVDDNLQKNGLNNRLTDNEKNMVINIILNAKDSETLNKDPDSYKDQANQISDKLNKNVDQLKDKINDNKDTKSTWQKIKDWFSNLF